VIVENRPSGPIPGEILSKASPDGYTLMFNGMSHWLLPFFQEKLPWDPVKDFTPISLTTTSPNILVVHPSVPVKSVKELIALAKSKPGALNYSSSGSGSATHLAAALFTSMAGVNMVRVPYKGSGPALNAVNAGEVQVMFPTPGGVGPLISSGRVRALGVTSAQPSALFPDLPTVAATVPGYEASSSNGIFAPAKTPVAIINRLHEEIVSVLNKAEVKQRLLSLGVEAVGSSPKQFAATLKADMSRLGKVIKDAGIRAD
jgi:tripartite-type tricarboxylate transporter receptor subunit TctC